MTIGPTISYYKIFVQNSRPGTRGGLEPVVRTGERAAPSVDTSRVKAC